MATGTVGRNANGIANRACGKATGDGTALSVTLGFKPMTVTLFNVTDGVRFEYIEGMDANTTMKNDTADTTGAITAVEKGFIVAAAANITGKKLVWYAD